MVNINNLLNNLLSAFPQLGANQPVNNTVPAANGSPVINNNNVVATYRDFFTSTSNASMWGIDRGANLELLGTEAMEKIYYNALQNGGELTPQNYFDLAKHQKLMSLIQYYIEDLTVQLYHKPVRIKKNFLQKIIKDLSFPKLIILSKEKTPQQ